MSIYYVAIVPEEIDGETFNIQQPVDNPDVGKELYPRCEIREIDSTTNVGVVVVEAE